MGQWRLYLQRSLFEDLEATGVRERPGRLQELTYFRDAVYGGKSQCPTMVHWGAPQTHLQQNSYRYHINDITILTIKPNQRTQNIQ